MRETNMLVFVVMMCLTMNVMVESSQTVMKTMTKNFLKAYEICEKEFNIREGTASQMLGFWKEDFTTSSRDVGCAIYCLSTKADLLDPEGKVHHGNAVDFAIKHGASEEMAKKVVEFLHSCEQSTPANEDKCMHALGIAMCFKKEVHAVDWAPDPEVLFEEVIGEMR